MRKRSRKSVERTFSGVHVTKGNKVGKIGEVGVGKREQTI